MLPNCDDSTACPPGATFVCRLRVRKTRRSNRQILIAAPVNLDVEGANLLSQGVAVEAQQVSGANLVTPGRRQCRRQQGNLVFLPATMAQAPRRYPVIETPKIR